MAATTASLVSKAAVLSASRNGLSGAAVAQTEKAVTVKAGSLVCRAGKAEDNAVISRRSAVTLFGAAISALTLKAEPSLAAYGQSANIFGKAPTNTDYIPYTGEGFSVNLPSKWNPSKEYNEFPNIVLRYEDNADTIANLVVIVEKTDKSSISQYGSPEEFLSQFGYLLGQQVYSGETASEGGFAKNITAQAALLESSTVEKDGKTYYALSVLTRTADGNEGGKHVLLTAGVSGGKLYILKVQAGDKRWFKGVKKFVEGAASSFVVA